MATDKNHIMTLLICRDTLANFFQPSGLFLCWCRHCLLGKNPLVGSSRVVKCDKNVVSTNHQALWQTVVLQVGQNCRLLEGIDQLIFKVSFNRMTARQHQDLRDSCSLRHGVDQVKHFEYW